MNLSEQEAADTIGVLEYLKERESDSDHVMGLEHCIEDIKSLHDVEGTEDIGKDEVATALDVLDRGSSQYDNMRYQHRTVDLEARYVNGELPEPRDWNAVYVFPDGSEIEEDIDFTDTTRRVIEKDGTVYVLKTSDSHGGTVRVTMTEPDSSVYGVRCSECGLFEKTTDIDSLDIEWNDHQINITEISMTRIDHKMGTVSQIGDKMISKIHDTFSDEEIAGAVTGETDLDFTRVPGIGSGTAESLHNTLIDLR